MWHFTKKGLLERKGKEEDTKLAITVSSPSTEGTVGCGGCSVNGMKTSMMDSFYF